ncbi:hypothetical protein AFCA_011245 [Aspergillus flavus]|nr:hypothetical protein AFCA_011245 [Aspergillus flavus]
MSDEEGIEPQKTRVAESIQQIEKQMFTIINISGDNTSYIIGPSVRSLDYRAEALVRNY